MGLLLLSTPPISGGDSEIVVAIRYLQAKGTSHSHLYLYREDGKLLRQLTNDNSGQDSDPIFASDGETIVFSREKPNDTREFWSIDPRGTKLKKLDTAPDWYSATKSSPYFTSGGEEEAPSSSPTPPQEESPSAATPGSAEQGEHRSVTALDAVTDATDHPPEIIKAPDGSGEIFWRKGKEGEGPEEVLNWVMWFRDSKSSQETQIGRLRGFPSFEPLHFRGNKDQPFLFEGALRLVFFSTHLDSSNGDTIEAFDFNKRKLIQLSPNYATPVPLPGEPAFLTLTENRYVTIPGSTKTANCSYIERWAANLKESCDNYEAYLRFQGVSSDEVVEGFTRDEYEKQLRENKEKGTSATDSQKCVTRAKGVPRSATALPCIGPEKLRPSSPSATERIKTNMKRTIPVSATWIWAIAAFFVFSNAPHGFAKPQKKAAGSAPENADPLVNAAMKNMETGVWSVNGTVTAKKPIKLQGLLSGEDFDLAMEPGVNPNTPMREIVIKNKAWICSDGETWHATRPDDRLIYNWAHVPIMADRKLPPFEKVGSEQRNGQTLLHVRLKVPEKNINPKELPQYWLVLDSQGQAQYIGHTEMPMFSQARKEVMYCSFDYAPAKENIAPPPLGAPVDDKAYGFNDIEQHKFDWKGKVVRLEVTPKILESKQIGEDTYRGFLKDTATPNHYGIVEFPHDALVKLGFLKKIVDGAHATEELEKMGALGRTDGKPVSFYVQVIPIGEKPAARAVAVGARLVRDPDGSVSYTWDSDEKQTAKSPPAPTALDSSDGDLVNRGIEKAKNGDLDGAIADFDRAAELNPKDDAPYYNRAQARRLKNDMAGTIADYTKAIELGSTNPAAYNNRGNARAENKDRDGAIADYTRAIELKPDYARAYYNRAVLKKEKGDAAGAAADFKRAQKLDPELVSEGSAPDSSSNRGTANGEAAGTTVSLLDGKLKLDIPSDFSHDANDPKNPKTMAKFSGPEGAWGEVLRGTHGLTPDKLDGYLKMRVAEYSKGFNWLPKDSHLQWLKKDIVTIDGRKWADWRYVPMLKGTKDYSHSPVYTRFLTTSYKGQLLEITFTSNLNTNPELKKEIDHIMDSVHLEE